MLRTLVGYRIGRLGLYLCAIVLSTAMALVAPAPALAQEGGWQWQNPWPQGNTLNAVWGVGKNDVYAVGEWGTVLHYNGSTWTSMASGTTATLNGVWGSGKDDIFVAGSGVVVHYDGTTWSAIGSPPLNAVWGSSGSDVFFVGQYGIILHYDGGWAAMASGTGVTLDDVWGASGSDVFAVGGGGTILHYDGNSWSPMASGTSKDLTGVWGSSGTDVYAVEVGGGIYDFGRLLHYDGANWTPWSRSQAVSSDVSMATGHTFDVWGWGESDLFTTGDFCSFPVACWGTVAHHHYDGSGWQTESGSGGEALHGVWGSSASDVYAVGTNGTILHYDGAAWVAVGGAAVMGVTIADIWGSSDSDVYAVGLIPDGWCDGGECPGYMLHYDGSGWSVLSNGDDYGDLLGVWGSGADDVFAVGEAGVIRHYDGADWTAMDSHTDKSLTDVWGTSSNDVFAVGDKGTILHYDGSSWHTVTTGIARPLNGVWGSSGTDVFAVGEEGTILHYDGTNLTAMDSGYTEPWESLRAVWGSSGQDVFAVGEGRLILHYDGAGWTSMIPDMGTYLQDVWGSGAKDVFVVGEYGMILHYDGTGWASMGSFMYSSLLGIWGDGQGAVFAAGEDSAILHLTGAISLDAMPDFWFATPDSTRSALARLDGMGYAGPVTLTTSTLPPGVTVMFDPNPAPIGEPFAISVHVDSGVMLARYPVEITGASGDYTVDRVITIAVVDEVFETYLPLMGR